jgi:4-amino-4-deoxy-L-arabinose transferase-like glycosyltransferase
MEVERLRTSPYFWILALLSAILMLAPIRAGDLAGYDDALYAHIAKGVTLTGDWLNIRSNGGPALEHPPLLVWTQAALFSFFGFSDTVAKLPAALSGLGTVLLVYWLARRLLKDSFQAAMAMFVMATSIYFLKYAARAMTDVPCTFLFIAAICAWVLTEEDPRWYLVTGVLSAMALMSRGMIGFALPVIFAAHLIISRRRPPIGYAVAALSITFLPLAAWYAYTISANREIFFGVHATWLRNEVFGSLSPPWRRYTGAPEYLWMISKSYWPWLPAMVLGIVTVVRNRDRKLSVLVIWIAVVFLLCAMARSRVLRYMLPAYPAFAVLAAIGLSRFVKDYYLRAGMRILTPIFAVIAVYVALFPQAHWHAAEIRPIATAETAATPAGQRFVFYDKGDPRYDETNQLQWYGGRNLTLLLTIDDLKSELKKPETKIVVVDRATFDTYIAPQIPHKIIAESGHLICFQLGFS